MLGGDGVGGYPRQFLHQPHPVQTRVQAIPNHLLGSMARQVGFGALLGLRDFIPDFDQNHDADDIP